MAIHTVRLGKNKYVTLDSYYRPGSPAVAITAGVVGILLTLSGIYTVMKMDEPDIIPIPVKPYKPSNQINS